MHHYASKTDLLVAAGRHLADQRGANLRARAAGLADDEDRPAQAIDLLWDTMSGPLFTATLELWAASRTDAELRRALLESERGLRAHLDHVMAELFGARASSEPAFAGAMEMTLQFLRGAALTSILRESRGRQQAVIDGWKKLFSHMLEEP
jgi:AcrR family transcriptional regulator